MCDMYEYNEKARRSLAKVVKSFDIQISSLPSWEPLSNTSTIYVLDLPDMLRIVEEQLRNINNNSRIKIKPVTHDQYLANIDNPFKKPYAKLAWRVDVENAIEIITSSDIYANMANYQYEIRYVEKPMEIDISNTNELDLMDDDLDKIVLSAVNLALRSLSVVSQKRA